MIAKIWEWAIEPSERTEVAVNGSGKQGSLPCPMTLKPKRIVVVRVRSPRLSEQHVQKREKSRVLVRT